MFIPTIADAYPQVRAASASSKDLHLDNKTLTWAPKDYT